VQFEIAIRASQGARRSQEDCALVWPRGASTDTTAVTGRSAERQPDTAVAVLCDGMGGHRGGALASRLACENFLPAILEATPVVRSRLMEALNTANGAIAQKVEKDPANKGMGSTLVGVYITRDGLDWISVGDSLLYLIRDTELRTLNADHSLAPEIDKLAESGKISWQAARADPRRHYLRSALTGDDIDMIDLSEQTMQLLDGDVLILASDGIHTLETDAIARIVIEAGRGAASTIAERLIDAVDDAGAPHQDNTTVVAICVRATSRTSDHV
jgi:PPM family protein phosphatase